MSTKMYFIFVNNDIEESQIFASALHQADAKKNLIVIPNGFELIQFLQDVKRGDSYPDLIILTPKFLRLNGMDLLGLLKTDDFYRLIPVVMLLPEKNNSHEDICNKLGTTHMPSPKSQIECMSAVNKMCMVCF